MPQNLYRRSSGIYVVRIAVPHRIRPQIGRTEIHVSTGQVELNAAKVAGLEILLAWRKRFMELDSTKLTSSSPLLQTSGTINLQDASTITGIPLTALLGEMHSYRIPLWFNVTSLPGIWVPDLYEVERDDNNFVWNSVENLGEQKTLFGIVARVHDSHAALLNLISEGTTTVYILRLGGSAAFFIEEGLELETAQFAAEKASIEAIRSRLASLLPAHPTASVTTHFPVHSQPPSVLDPVTAKHGHKKFSELFDLYQKDRSWSLDQKRRMNTEAGLFIQLIGDPTLGSIERETILEYAEKLASLPNKIDLARRKYKVDALDELILVANAKGLPRKGEDTVKRHVGYLSEIMNYGARNKLLTFNPAADFKRSKKVAPAQSKREKFSPDELNLIFSTEFFITGRGKFESRGWTEWRPFNFWLPLLGLLTGARINELSQLYLEDIKCSESGTWFIDFNLEQSDKIDADQAEQDKSLKTVNAIRIIPLHKRLIDLGFLNYIDSLRKAGHKRLFPELKHDHIKGYGKPAGAWFNERFLGKKLRIKRDGKKVFHSFRHNFITALERLDVTESVRAQLAGHQRGKTESGSRYSKDRNADELKPTIEKLDFSCLAKVAPFDTAAGLEALKIALRIKQSNSKKKVNSSPTA